MFLPKKIKIFVHRRKNNEGNLEFSLGLQDAKRKIRFQQKVGGYSANDCDAGDLIVISPTVGQIYAYGQKDYRSSNSLIRWAK